jgi:hypothetical protein
MAQMTSWGVESMTRTFGTGVGHAAATSMLASVLWLERNRAGSTGRAAD